MKHVRAKDRSTVSAERQRGVKKGANQREKKRTRQAEEDRRMRERRSSTLRNIFLALPSTIWQSSPP